MHRSIGVLALLLLRTIPCHGKCMIFQQVKEEKAAYEQAVAVGPKIAPGSSNFSFGSSCAIIAENVSLHSEAVGWHAAPAGHRKPLLAHSVHWIAFSATCCQVLHRDHTDVL